MEYSKLWKSKSEVEINFITNTLKNYDIIAIQEVVAGYGGVNSSCMALNRKGVNGIILSDPTSVPHIRRNVMLLFGRQHM
jgi:hypothetical protein